MANPTGAAAVEKNYLLILAAAGILLFISIAGFFTYQSAVSRNQSLLSSARLLVDSLRSLVKTGADAENGVAPDFALVQSLTEGVSATLAAYQEGNAELGISALPADSRTELEALTSAWAPMKSVLNTITENALPYARSAVALKALTAAVHPALKAYADALEKTPRSGNDNYLLSRQLLRLNRMQTLVQQILGDGKQSVAAAKLLNAEVAEFQREHKTLAATGSIDRVTAKSVSDVFDPADAALGSTAAEMPAVAAVQLAAISLPSFAGAAQTAADTLRQKIISSIGVAGAITLISALAAVAALILLGLYVYLTITQTRRREKLAKAYDQQQQQAILSLLDEITNLADGDLTGELTVTADFTGNIADSLNYTVQTLRGLVGTITDTSVEIAAAASSTTERVQQMSKASEGQAREIVRAAQSMSSASRSLEEVAGRAEKLAEQAKGSVDTAHSGAATVGRTIAGMSTLREQIQDTAKRIKRLGESSQEIGNIIEFINDIAEQTNTLALNASIQAAMAGESGRGFAVVADEVQRLAERAASATKQIESLVKTIQADTQEAITSMERSTANVVGGAKSAEEAGLALTRIEANSQELAKLIQDIAGASRTQSAETTKLAAVMQGIREVSVQTSSTARVTAESVGELNTLSAKLRESVSGFKLPMDISAI